MSAEEYVQTGYLLSYNNGLVHEWHDDKDSCHIRAGNLDLSDYYITTYTVDSHVLYHRGHAVPTQQDYGPGCTMSEHTNT